MKVRNQVRLLKLNRATLLLAMVASAVHLLCVWHDPYQIRAHTATGACALILFSALLAFVVNNVTQPKAPDA